MPEFDYKAKRTPTETISGRLEASTRHDAVRKLVDQGLSPFQVEETVRMPGPGLTVVGESAKPLPASPASGRAPSIKVAETRTMRLGGRELDRFTRQLATLVRTNVPILRSLVLIGEQQGRSPRFTRVVDDIREQVSQGQQLSEAMRRYPLIFDELYISMVFAGERGSALAETLTRLADHREMELETRRRIQAAMAYPAFVIIVGVATVFTVVTFILPRVIHLFENMEQRLPVPTLILMGITHFMQKHWYWPLLIMVIGFLVFTGKKTGSRSRQVGDFIRLHTPIIKTMISHAEVAKFARTLSMLIKNGVSVHEGLQLATGTVQNLIFKAQLVEVGQEIVNRGSTLSGSLSRREVFPRFAVNMIAVGEEGGELAEALAEVAKSYEKEVEQSIRLLISMLEPALILVVGGVVAFIVFAMLMPIFQIGNF